MEGVRSTLSSPCGAFFPDGWGLESGDIDPFRSALEKGRNPPSVVAIAGIGKERIRLEIYSVGWAGQEHPKTPLEEVGQNLCSAKDPLSPQRGGWVN